VSTTARGNVAFAAIGAGLIHLALVVGSPLPFAAVFAAVGAAELVWGVATMAAARLPLPRVAFAGALVPPLLWAAVLLGEIVLDSAAPLPLLPLAAASALGFFAAAVIGVQLRRPTPAPPRPEPGAARYLVGLFAGALVVASITTPALAATEAGRYARPHGEHAGLVVDLGHGDHR
jgi:hypothetical protein